MTPHAPRLALVDAGAVHAAGAAITGDSRCRGCSYQVTVYRSLPACPMCGGTSWSGRPARRLTRRLRPGAAPGGQQAGGDRRAA
jgi:tRNA(Arg) A34 adenosine deaminase TadA